MTGLNVEIEEHTVYRGCSCWENSDDAALLFFDEGDRHLEKILVQNCCDEPEIEFQQLDEFDGALRVAIVDNKPDVEFEKKLEYPLVQGEATIMKDQQVKRIWWLHC